MNTLVRSRTAALGAVGALLASALLTLPQATADTQTPGMVVDWGDDSVGQTSIPDELVDASDVTAVSAGSAHSLALRSDGTVVGWGTTLGGDDPTNPVTVPVTVPDDLGTDVTAISAGGYHDVALHDDGTVTAWGYNAFGQLEVPDFDSPVVAVDAGLAHTLALLDDGTVETWGNPSALTPPSTLTDVVAVAAGGNDGIALLDDGTVEVWGRVLDLDGDIVAASVPDRLPPEVTAVTAGQYHFLALHADGTVSAWGVVRTADGLVAAAVPEGLTDVTAIAATNYQSVALHGDGTVTVWGYNAAGLPVVPAPSGLADVVAVDVGSSHGLAVVIPPTPAERVADLGVALAAMDVHPGVANALDAKLSAAARSLDRGNTASACGQLDAFLNQVSAQNGKALTTEQAEQLGGAATTVRDDLGC